MLYVSTRNKNLQKNLSGAIMSGLADDGGLYIPDYIPKAALKNFNAQCNYDVFAEKVLQPYFENDQLASQLREMCQNAFSFPVPLTQYNENTFVLELFHGPTLSFKDFGARFLAECLNKTKASKNILIMIATSGDTGSAVASAFFHKPHIQVVILYPEAKISRRQERQITCWNDNVRALSVNGTFDDCQQLVKSAFKEKYWNENFMLNSANSINIGRLLPQVVYYAYSSICFFEQHRHQPGYIIPTGNLGNATAAYLARLMGFPIREIVVATNANKTISNYLEEGEYRPRKSIPTLANAMDVGNPSNFERLKYLFNDFDEFKKNVKAFSVSDENIKKTIIKTYHESQMIICPHTATAFYVRQSLSDKPWIIVSTAHPSKFDTVIEPLIQCKIPIPNQLQHLLDKSVHITHVENNLDSVRKNIFFR